MDILNHSALQKHKYKYLFHNDAVVTFSPLNN